MQFYFKMWKFVVLYSVCVCVCYMCVCVCHLHPEC